MRKLFLLMIISLLPNFLKAQDVSPEERAALMAFYYATDGPNWINNTNWGTAAPVATWYGVSAFFDEVYGISLVNNGLSGDIPPEIGVFTEMRGLYLSNNQLTSIPPEIANCTQLGWCDLSHNNFSGPITPEIFKAGNMIDLNLSHNEFSGELPVEIGTPTSVTWMNLSHNQFSGSIPGEIGNLSSTLQSLYLNDNQLTGSIPVELNSMVMLSYMNFSNNQLTGTFTGLPSFYAFPSGYIITNNYFTFEGVEAISTLAAGFGFNINLEYSPQLEFPLTDNEIEVNLTQNVSLDIAALSVNNLGGANNRYEWFKDGVSISGPSTSSVLNLLNITESDLGAYVCHVTNVAITDLTLISEAITLKLPNRAPVVSRPISDRTFTAGFGSASGNVFVVFTDPDGDPLTYSATSSDPGVLDVSMVGSWIIATEMGVGTSLITVTADDGNGGSVSDDFYLTVTPLVRAKNTKSSGNEAINWVEDKPLLSSGFRVFPNPSFGNFIVENNNLSENSILEIVDSNGKTIYKQQLTEFKTPIDLTKNKKGMYFIRLNTDNKKLTEKIIVK